MIEFNSIWGLNHFKSKRNERKTTNPIDWTIQPNNEIVDKNDALDVLQLVVRGAANDDGGDARHLAIREEDDDNRVTKFMRVGVVGVAHLFDRRWRLNL